MPADIFPNKSFQAAKELPFDSFPLSLQVSTRTYL
jgi:hypothetical protein